MANESISIPDGLIAKLKAKNTKSLRGETVRTLERYFDILQTGRREIRKLFDDSELNFLADISNGTMFEPFVLMLENNALLMQTEDTEDIYGDEFYAKHDVDGATIKGKLGGLSAIGQIALIDLIETFRNNADRYQTVYDVFKNK